MDEKKISCQMGVKILLVSNGRETT